MDSKIQTSTKDIL